MELEGQTQIMIQNKVFTLGSPVIHANTLDQLLSVFQQLGISERPIVIINPVKDRVPDLDKLLENYIENAMQGQQVKHRTSYMFQDFTDEQITEWAVSQVESGSSQSFSSLVETGKAIREQSQLKRNLDQAKDRQAALWQQHCLHPESDEGSAEYAHITYTVIPQIELAIEQVTERMRNIPNQLDSEVQLKPNPENIVSTPVPESVELVEKFVENFVESNGEMVGTGKPDLEIFRTTNQLMPLSVAKQLAQSPQNKVFLEQQSQHVPGYATVPLEYLIALGIPLYADGVPVVYTKSGTFRRIGSSSVSPIVSAYWYPTPRYN